MPKSKYQAKETQLYLIEKILEEKKIEGQLHYLVKWDGYPMSQCTWEPHDNPGLKYAVEAYHKRLQVSPKTKNPKRSSTLRRNKDNVTLGSDIQKQGVDTKGEEKKSGQPNKVSSSLRSRSTIKFKKNQKASDVCQQLPLKVVSIADLYQKAPIVDPLPEIQSLTVQGHERIEVEPEDEEAKATREILGIDDHQLDAIPKEPLEIVRLRKTANEGIEYLIRWRSTRNRYDQDSYVPSDKLRKIAPYLIIRYYEQLIFELEPRDQGLDL